MTVIAIDDRGAAGFSWLVLEPVMRTSHALAAGGRVWLVDPVDEPEMIERACRLGRPAGVIQLLDRHNRDCAALADRLGVPHLVVPKTIPGSPFDMVEVVDMRGWREVALWWPDTRTLVVTEALGSNPFFTVGDDAVGTHGFLKLFPPRRRLGGFDPEHLLFGHGPGRHGEQAADDLRRALGRSRVHVVGWFARLPRANRRAQAFLRTLAECAPHSIV